MRCQRTYELAPFDLQITYPESTTQQQHHEVFTDREERRLSANSHSSECTDSISPSQLAPGDNTVDQDTQEPPRSDKRRQKSKSAGKTSETRPAGPNRTPSAGDTPRKRSMGSNVTTKTKSRPSITRKRTSETIQRSDTAKPRRSIMKSPRTSYEDQGPSHLTQPPQLNLTERMLASPTDGTSFPGRKISDFALTSASSWQSVESHAPRDNTASQASSSGKKALQIDGNFRERFLETQKILRSSTNLEVLNKTMRKTGSVVRFADDVDGPADIRRQKAIDKERDPEPTLSGISALRTVSEGQSSKAPTQCEVDSWRSPGLQRHNSIGSVAAVSDDSEVSDEESMMMLLPRTRSQLSLGIANLKRSQSQGEQTTATDNNIAVTSPEIEQEQDALISGRAGKKPSEEEEKLLAMGRKDGVTRAGGVNLPKELTVKGPRSPGDTFEEPEQPLF